MNAIIEKVMAKESKFEKKAERAKEDGESNELCKGEAEIEDLQTTDKNASELVEGSDSDSESSEGPTRLRPRSPVAR